MSSTISQVRIGALAIALAICSPICDSQEVRGQFVGRIVAEWGGDGRNMRLLENFAFIDSSGVEWKVPKNTVVDGASIPRAFWTAIGGPFEGPYRNASVVHDHFCVVKTAPWQQVHRMFYEAMLVGGTPIAKAKIMYYAVYVGGPRWKQVQVTNHEPRAFPRPGDIDRIETRNWDISFDQVLVEKHIKAIQASELTIEQIEGLANQAFTGKAPPDVIRLDQ